MTPLTTLSLDNIAARMRPHAGAKPLLSRSLDSTVPSWVMHRSTVRSHGPQPALVLLRSFQFSIKRESIVARESGDKGRFLWGSASRGVVIRLRSFRSPQIGNNPAIGPAGASSDNHRHGGLTAYAQENFLTLTQCAADSIISTVE